GGASIVALWRILQPTDQRHDRGRDRQKHTKFRGPHRRSLRLASDSVADRLDEQVVAAVGDRRRPYRTRFYAQPTENCRPGDDHPGETHERHPHWSARVVIRTENSRIVPQSPDDPGNQNRGECWTQLVKRGKEKPTPSNLFPEPRGGAGNNAVGQQ